MENVNERPYTLRKLDDSDLWPILDIIGKVLPEDLAPIFAQVMNGTKKLEEVGYAVATRLVMAVLRNIKLVHDEVYTFLSSVSGIPADEIPKMGFGTTPMMIWDIINAEKNAGFFGEFSR